MYIVIAEKTDGQVIVIYRGRCADVASVKYAKAIKGKTTKGYVSVEWYGYLKGE